MLKLFGYHGCYEKEKKEGQKFEIDMKISLYCINTLIDSLDSAIDYSEICSKIKQSFNLNRYNLLEVLAEDISNIPYELEKQNNFDVENDNRAASIGSTAEIFLVKVRVRKINPDGMDIPYVEVEYNNANPKHIDYIRNMALHSEL